MIASSIIGCGAIIPPPSPNASEQIQPTSKKPTIDLFLDGTLSMQGFVNPGVFNAYPQTVRMIDIGWPGAKYNYFRFGSSIVTLDQSTFKEGAVSPKFYQNREQTHIETVIENARKNNLTIIVTDLFQNDSDVPILIQKITSKFLQSDLAVGIIGIRSKFNGWIYDVGTSGNSFEYSSGDDPNRFRPFYLVVLGKHPDIVYYYETLKQNSLPESQLSIFSPYIVNSFPSFATAKINVIDKMAQLKTPFQDDRVRIFRTRAKNCSFQVSLLHNPLSYTFEFNDNKLEAIINVSKVQRNKFVTIESDTVTIEIADFTKELLTLDICFAPSNLPGKGLYLFDITLLRPSKECKVPAWINNWNMNNDCIYSNNGSTTLNLNMFMMGLWQANWQIHKPKVAHLYCYLQKS